MKLWKKKSNQKRGTKGKESLVVRQIRILLWRLFTRFKCRERIAKANAWADGHRRKTAGILFSVNATIYVIGFLLCMSGNDNNSINDPMQDFAQIQPMFAQLHRIEDMKTVQKNTFAQLGNRVVNLKHEVDSLMNKPDKTHADSVLALAKYEELQTIIGKTE